MKRQSKGIRKSKRQSKPKNNRWTITTINQFFELSERDHDVLLAFPEALSLMREKHLSASDAARAAGISRRLLVREGRSGLQKLKNGRYVAKPNDHLFRLVIAVSKDQGTVEVATNEFREASMAGKHSAAVQRYLETGDDSGLRRLPRNYIIDAQGNRIELLVDLDELDRLGSAGELSFESLYARNR